MRKWQLAAGVAAVALALIWSAGGPEAAREHGAAGGDFHRGQVKPEAGGAAIETRAGWLERLSVPAAEFRRWAHYYITAAPAEQASLLPEGRRLAAAHRAHMRQLIPADPRRALEEAVPMVLRQALPPEIETLLEQRVNARGFYGVRGRAEAGADGQAIRRTFFTASGESYEAVVYGRRVRQRTSENEPVHGVAVDGWLALHEDPLRPMETGERIRPGAQVSLACPVSGNTVLPEPPVVIEPDVLAVETGGEVRILCSGGHIRALNEQLKAAEGGTGGPVKPTGPVPATWSTGVKSVLYIRVAFSDQPADPQVEKDSYDMMKQVNDFFVENSHGQLHLLTTVTPLLQMPKPESWYKANDTSDADAILADARSAARAAGFDYAAYDLEAVRYNGASGGFSGQAYVFGRGCWLKSSSAGVAVHEFGHNLGLWHANFWSTSGESVTGSGSNSEYGNSFDTMGAANAGSYFFNAGHQQDIRWLADENVTRVTGPGIYRVYQHDQGRIDPANRYLLAIRKDQQRDYWCEFRQKFTANAWLTSGLLLNWSPWGDSSSASTAYGSNGGGQLLDTTPGSPDGKNDSAVVIGRTFSDPGAQLHITPLAKSGTVPESLDVMVQSGAFPGNVAPSLELTAAALTAAVNAPVEFSAAALDPNGDPLAYSWDWGDRTVGPNAATASKAWAAAGLYTVRCEVSDMRGGVTSRLLQVSVGTHSQSFVRGQILTDGGQPLAGVRVSLVPSSNTSATPKVCLTDSDGWYAVSGLAAGTWNATAVAPAFTFTAAMPNPLTVGPEFTAAHFTAAVKTAVEMTLTDSSCTEAGDAAVLRFARVAGSAAAAVDVRVFVGGSAGMSDVDFTPAETYDLTTYKFTIPAGQPSLDVAVTAFNDSTAEGPETLTFFLIDGSGYLPSGVESATLLINDNDTALPVISVETVASTLTEGGNDALLRLSRTGSTAALLVVSLTRGGTAAAGTDYTGLNTTATIPAGVAFVDVPVSAVQDSAAEGSESLTVSIATTASWIRSPVSSTATFTVLDDDIPVLTVTATDAAAAEAGSDPAVFLVSRTGNLSAALTVDYALGGTAHHGTDYAPLSGTVTIPAGLAHSALVITPVDDSIGEPQQTVSVNLRSAARYTAGLAFSATATLADNDVPHVMATVADGTSDEAGGTGKFRIQSYGSGTGNITVLYAITGSAVAGTDYTALTGTATVPRGGYVELTVAPLQDTEFEDAEDVRLTLLPDAAYTLAPENTASLRILDDDQPMVAVAAAAVSYAESSGPAKFHFTRTGATTDALTVNYTLTGTAAAGQDYAAATGAVAIAAGASSATLDVILQDDTDAEGAETLNCVITPQPGSYGLRAAEAQVFLTDSETAGLTTAAFAAGTSSVPESAGSVSLTVTIGGPAAGEVRVDYALDSGSAFQGVDYTAQGGTLVFAAGETAKTIPMEILEDTFKEPSETIVLRLLRVQGGRLGTQQTHTLTISDNDVLPPPVAGFVQAASSTGEAAGQPAQVLVFLSAPQSSPVSLAWAVTGGTADAADIAASGGTLTFQPGETVRGIPLSLTDDSLMEPAETVILTISEPQAPLGLAPAVTHTLTILDNDDTAVSIAASGALEEGRSEPAVVTVARVSTNVSLALPVALTFSGTASAGSDYAAPSASVTIPAGAASVQFSISALDDAVLDPDESLQVTLAASDYYTLGSPSSVTLGITDNETGVYLGVMDDTAGEPGDTAQLKLTRSGPLGSDLSVDLNVSGTAQAGADFIALPSPVTFAAGEPEVLLTLTPVDDETAEPEESLTVSIAPSASYHVGAGDAVIRFTDDDTNLPPQVAIVSPVGGSVFLPFGPGLLLDATVTDDGRPRPTVPLEIEWTMLSGTGAVSFDDPHAADTGVVFSEPGSYVVQLRAADAESASTAQVNVFVLGTSLTGGNIGTASTATGLSGGGSAWTLTSAGSGVSTGTSDGCYFAQRPMIGDFTVIARVASITGAGTSTRSGVMVRGAATAGSKHAAMAVTSNRSSFIWRGTDNAAGSASNTNQSAALPRYVRLVRTGNFLRASHSPDGLTWTNQGSQQTITMSDPVLVGLFATSASTNGTVTAAFDQFAIIRTGNVAPFVDAGAVMESAALNLPLTGTVSDDTVAPLVQWLRLSGPGSVDFPAAAAGEVLFTAPGTHRLRLTATDGSASVFDDTTAVIAHPFYTWLQEQFPESFTDPTMTGPTADPDCDGLENLAEYALGLDPDFPDAAAGVPAAGRDGDLLSLTWRESTGATGVLVSPEWSSDLLNWSDSGFTIEATATGTGWVERRATLDVSARRCACLQLRVQLP
jgi:hypothetical protein